jgi:hypothetical protein
MWSPALAFPLTLLGAVVLILAYDTVSALLVARTPSFAYRKLWPVQLALYVLIGFVAALTLLNPKLVGVTGAITGLVDATAGWAITSRIGPGRVPGTTFGSIVTTIFALIAFGFGLALLGAWIFSLVARAMIAAHH